MLYHTFKICGYQAYSVYRYFLIRLPIIFSDMPEEKQSRIHLIKFLSRLSIFAEVVQTSQSQSSKSISWNIRKWLFFWSLNWFLVSSNNYLCWNFLGSLGLTQGTICNILRMLHLNPVDLYVAYNWYRWLFWAVTFVVWPLDCITNPIFISHNLSSSAVGCYTMLSEYCSIHWLFQTI